MPNTKEQKLARIINEASNSASRALTKLSGEKVNVSVSRTEITKINRRFPGIKPETIVVGVYLPITGDFKGVSLLVIPEKIACTLCDLLVKRKPETTLKLTELDKSALKEVGNIICGSFLTVFSNTTNVRIIENVPSLSIDMFGAVVDMLVTKFAKNAEDSLIMEIKFVFEKADIKGYFNLIFGLEQVKEIMKILGVGSA